MKKYLMKKKFLKSITLIILLNLFLATNSNAVVLYKTDEGNAFNFYGRLQQNFGNNKTHTPAQPKSQADNSIEGEFDGRFGINATLYVNPYFNLIGVAEYQVGAAEYGEELSLDQYGNAKAQNNELTARYVWTGLDFKDYGKLKFGRVDSGVIMLSDVADIFATDAGAKTMGARAGQIDRTAVRMFRQDSSASYYINMANTELNVAYATGSNVSAIEDMYNATLRYTLNLGTSSKIKPVVSFQSTRGDKNADISVQTLKDYQSFGAGITYEYNDDNNYARLGFVFSEDKLNSLSGSDLGSNTAYEANITYMFKQTYKVQVGYANLTNSNVQFSDNTFGSAKVIDEIGYEAQYLFNPTSLFFVSYISRNALANQLKNGAYLETGIDKEKSADIFKTGLRFSF
jgi:predicted porin